MRKLNGDIPFAAHLRDGRIRFELLDAPLLLKHMLGLAQPKTPWKLFCLWYGPPDPLTDRHTEDLSLFSQRLGSDSAKFEALTYRELFYRLCRALGREHDVWQSYMRNRYF